MNRILNCFLQAFFRKDQVRVEEYQQSGKDSVYSSLQYIEHSLPTEIDKASTFIPKFICNIYSYPELEPYRSVLDADLFGSRILIFLALIYNPSFIQKDGRIDLKYARIIIECILEKVKEEQEKNFPIDTNGAAQRIVKFLEQMQRKNSEPQQAVQGIKLKWVEENKCHLIFGGLDAFNNEINELAGEILFKYHSEKLPSAIQKLSERPLIGNDIKNIIVLAPEIVDVLCKLGAAEKVVGILRKPEGLPLPNAQELYSKSEKAINYSLISRLDPDLILASQKQAEMLELSNQINCAGKMCIVPLNGDNEEFIEELGVLLKVDYWTELAAHHRQASTISSRCA